MKRQNFYSCQEYKIVADEVQISIAILFFFFFLLLILLLSLASFILSCPLANYFAFFNAFIYLIINCIQSLFNFSFIQSHPFIILYSFINLNFFMYNFAISFSFLSQSFIIYFFFLKYGIYFAKFMCILLLSIYSFS